MKNILTFIFGLTLSIFSLSLQAQDLNSRADVQTRQMASKLKLNEGEYKKLKALNFNRLAKIDALASLREQDHRYLDLRLDEIEEDYNAAIYDLLKPKQYAAFIDYKKEQPYTYAEVVSASKYEQAKSIAISTEE